jgi:flagellar hook-associated protein 3 FlgL
MISGLDSAARSFLANLEEVTRRAGEAQRQISSGKRIQCGSDAPDQIAPLLELRSSLAANTQVQANLAAAKTEVETGQNALTSAINIIQRALTLAGQGANSIAGAEQRATIAQEVAGIQEQILSITQTAVNGRYIFSGDQYQSAPEIVDPPVPGDPPALVAATSTRQIQDAAGARFTVGQTAQEIFDARNPDGTAAAGNVLAALTSLINGLKADDTAAITSSMTAMRDASRYLNTAQAAYGMVQNRLQDGLDDSAKRDTSLKSRISQVEDADVVAAILEVTQASTAQQAALEARAKVPQTSLFDFLR